MTFTAYPVHFFAEFIFISSGYLAECEGAVPPLFAGYIPKDQIREQPKRICTPNTGYPVLGVHISVVYLVFAVILRRLR